MIKSILLWASGIKWALIAGGIVVAGLTAGGLFINKKLKEAHYRRSIKKEHIQFQDCLIKANNEPEIQNCYSNIGEK